MWDVSNTVKKNYNESCLSAIELCVYCTGVCICVCMQYVCTCYCVCMQRDVQVSCIALL